VAQLLQDLVRIPSVNPSLDPTSAGEAALAEVVARQMRAAGFGVRLEEALPGRPNVVARAGPEPTPERPALLFECHMDTVPLGAMRDGLSPAIREGCLHARGACDVKGGLAAMLIALARFTRAHKPLLLWATVDEEHDYRGVQALAQRGVAAAGAVVAEPTGLRPVLAHRGNLRLEVVARGRAAHSSRPDLGENAILRAARLVEGLGAGFAARFGRRVHPLCGGSTWSVTQIATDNPVNVVPDRCRLGVDVRLTPGLGAAEVLGWLDAALAGSGIPAERRQLRPEDPALDTDPAADVARWAVEAASAVLGEPVAPQGAPYSTDASKIAALAGVPAVVLGPGDIGWAHTAEERIPLDELEKAVEVYAGIIERFLEA
jgi:acetylornithine deacetylase/succinyl-diaminopimelate desuccinylase-like protein